MKSILIRGSEAIVNGDGTAALEKLGTDIRISNGTITEIGCLTRQNGECVIEAAGCLAYPGFVNTHHHLFQSVLKSVKGGLDDTLTPWLLHVPYAFRPVFTEEIFRTSVQVGLVEMALSGCSTVADHNYLYWPDMAFDPSAIIFEEAERIGLRMVLCRGGQTVKREIEISTNKALQPETLDGYLNDLSRLTALYHDTGANIMRKVVAAPTSPLFSMSPGELREVAQTARALGIKLHSHLSETVYYQDVCMAQHGSRPIDFAGSVDWLGEDVWFAHLVHLDAEEIRLLGDTRTGMSHCPQSNGRLGSGIAPVKALEAAGCNISLGVDGAASNECADMLGELHAAFLMARARGGLFSRAETHGGSGESGASDVTAIEVVDWATRGGAQILGWPNIGVLREGMAADIALLDVADPVHWGAHTVPFAPVMSGRASVRYLLVNGELVVDRGVVRGIARDRLRWDAAQAVKELMGAQ